MGVIIAVLAFGLMIGIHEFGHFIVAKLTGMIVTEFSIGMGPTIWKKRIGETKYSLRLLPIGGFVSVYGEDSLESKASEKSAEKEVKEEQEGESDLQSTLQSTLQFDSARSYENIPIWKRALFISAGAIMNLVLGFVLMLGVMSSAEVLATTTVAHPEGVPEIRVGDTILSVDGNPVFEMMDFDIYATFDADRRVDVEVLRNNEKVLLSDVDISEYQYLIPVGVKNSLINSINATYRFTASSISTVIYSLKMLVTGAIPVTSMSGPVGVTAVITEVVPYGWDITIRLIALISINLGIMNLLPIPALDGGHLLFLLIELIRRKPISRKIQSGLQVAVMCSLLVFLVAITGLDIYRWVTGFFAATVAG